MNEMGQRKLVWLQRFLYRYAEKEVLWKQASYIISKLEDIEEEYWISRQEADMQTHVGEKYGD